jgi:hypothetical protein
MYNTSIWYFPLRLVLQFNCELWHSLLPLAAARENKTKLNETEKGQPPTFATKSPSFVNGFHLSTFASALRFMVSWFQNPRILFLLTVSTHWTLCFLVQLYLKYLYASLSEVAAAQPTHRQWAKQWGTKIFFILPNAKNAPHFSLSRPVLWIPKRRVFDRIKPFDYSLTQFLTCMSGTCKMLRGAYNCNDLFSRGFFPRVRCPDGRCCIWPLYWQCWPPRVLTFNPWFYVTWRWK